MALPRQVDIVEELDRVMFADLILNKIYYIKESDGKEKYVEIKDISQMEPRKVNYVIYFRRDGSRPWHTGISEGEATEAQVDAANMNGTAKHFYRDRLQINTNNISNHISNNNSNNFQRPRRGTRRRRGTQGHHRSTRKKTQHPRRRSI